MKKYRVENKPVEKDLPNSNEMTDLDETVLFLTRPYGIAALVCLALSLFCMIYLWHDKQSSAFVMSVLTFGVDSFFLVMLYIKAKKIRKKKN